MISLVIRGFGIGVVMAAASMATAAEPGVYPDRIVIGQVAAQTGGLAPIVKELTAGASAYFTAVNAEGGVHGRKIVLQSVDDGQDPKRTAELTRGLAQSRQVFSLFLYRGTPNAEAVFPLLDEFKIPLVAPSTGALSMYAPAKRYLFPVRASYASEAEVIVNHLVGIGITKIAILRDDSAFGKDGLTGFESAMARRGVKPGVVTTFPRGTTKVEEAVKTIGQSEPQAIVVVAPPNAAAAFIKQMKQTGSSAQLFVLSNVSSASFVKDLGDLGRGTVVSQVAPHPSIYDTKITRDFQALSKTRPDLPLSYAGFEGYIAARVLVEGLRRAGPQLTREKFVNALESLRHYDMGGVEVDYGPGNRTGSRYVELTIVTVDGKFLR